MKNFMIDAVILQNFKNGVKAAAGYNRKSAPGFANGDYQMGYAPSTDIEPKLDQLINTFCNDVINECMSFVRDNVSLRLQIQEMALKYNMPIDYLENYIFEGVSSSVGNKE